MKNNCNFITVDKGIYSMACLSCYPQLPWRIALTLKTQICAEAISPHTPHRQGAIRLFICLKQRLMKGQPLSYDRISWPQQPKRGWPSPDCVCLFGWGRPVMSVCCCHRASEEVAKRRKWASGNRRRCLKKQFTSKHVIEKDSFKRKTNRVKDWRFQYEKQRETGYEG